MLSLQTAAEYSTPRFELNTRLTSPRPVGARSLLICDVINWTGAPTRRQYGAAQQTRHSTPTKPISARAISTSRRLRARVAAEGATAAALALVHGSLLLLGESLRGGARLGPLLLARRGLLALLDVLGVLEVAAAAGLEREREEDEKVSGGRTVWKALGKTASPETCATRGARVRASSGF